MKKLSMEDVGATEADFANAQSVASAEAVDPGFWSIPNSFVKKVRKMSTNELRDKVHTLARALMDQHNANIILSERLKTQAEELKELRVLINKASDGETSSMEGTQNEK